MKKILIATDCFLPRWDGVARFLSEAIPRLEDHYEMKVVAPRFGGKFEWIHVSDVIRFPLTGIMVADYPACKPSYSEIKKQVKNADIVWVHTLGPIGIISIIEASRQKKKLVAQVHSFEWELFPRSINTIHAIKWTVKKLSTFTAKWLHNKCNLIIVPSNSTAWELERKGIKPQKKVITLGTNTKTFGPPDDKRKAKQALGIEPETTVIGYAGRIGLEKNLETLYRAFGRINRKYNTILLIAGQDLSGVTAAFKSNPKVKVFGATNNIAQYLQAMDIYVLPSLTETTSLSTMEAMSCQLAVITTNVGSIKDYVKEGVNGMFFPKGNAYELAKKLDYLLKNEPLRKKLGENARITIINKYSWDKTIKELKEVFDSSL